MLALVVALLDQRVSRSPVRTVDSVIVLRKGAGIGANAASIVYARIAGLGGCAAGPAACVLLSSEAGSSGLRAAHGGSRRCGGGKSQSVRDLLALVAVLLARTHARRVFYLKQREASGHQGGGGEEALA